MGIDGFRIDALSDFKKATGMRDVPANDAKFHNARDLYYNVNGFNWSMAKRGGASRVPRIPSGDPQKP